MLSASTSSALLALTGPGRALISPVARLAMTARACQTAPLAKRDQPGKCQTVFHRLQIPIFIAWAIVANGPHYLLPNTVVSHCTYSARMPLGCSSFHCLLNCSFSHRRLIVCLIGRHSRKQENVVNPMCCSRYSTKRRAESCYSLNARRTVISIKKGEKIY